MGASDQNQTQWPSLEVNWTTPADSELWDRLAGGMETDARVGYLREDDERTGESESDSSDVEDEQETARNLFALAVSPEREPRYVQLALVRSAKDGTLFWVLSIRKMPRKPPPERIVQINNQFGGHAGLMSIINEVCARYSPVAVFEMRYSFSADLSVAGGLLSNVEMAVGCNFAKTISVDHISLNLKDGKHGIDSLILGKNSPKDRTWFIAQFAKELAVQKGDAWFPELSAVCHDIISSFFSVNKE